ncbi:MAG: PEGA domain-containing protein [Planctomycetota bacterium]
MLGWTHARALIVSTLVLFAPLATAQPATERTETIEETTTTIHEVRRVIQERTEQLARPPVVAVFVKNRADAAFDQKTRVLEDMLFGDLTSAGLSLVSPEDTVTAMRRFLRSEEERERLGLDDRASVEDENRLMSQYVDRVLENSTSALRLAQNMNADYVLVATITSYGTRDVRVRREDLGIDRTNRLHRMRCGYRVLSRRDGASQVAGNVSAEYREGADHNGGFADANDLVFDDLLAACSERIGGGLGLAIERDLLVPDDEDDGIVRLVVSCSVQDLKVPEIVDDGSGGFTLTATEYQLSAMDVTIELDGVVVGNAPGAVEGAPGLHRIRLTREGFSPWERMINLREPEGGGPMTLNVAMQLDETGARRFREFTAQFQGLKQGERLSRAQAEVAEGLAEMFRNSGIRINLGVKESDIAKKLSSFWNRGG